MVRERRKPAVDVSGVLVNMPGAETRERQPYPLEMFAKNLPDTIGVYAHETQRLMHEFAAVETVDSIFVRPVKSAEGLRRKIEKTTNEISMLEQPKDKIDGLVLSNMLGRLESLKARLGEYDKPYFDYAKVLRSMGIGTEDVEAALRKYKELDTQKIAEGLLAQGDEFEPIVPESGRQAETVKEYYIRFLKLSFEMAPRKLRGLFADFDDYMDKTVNFIEERDGGSYEKTDTIYLNIYGQGSVVNVRKGDRWIAIVDPFTVASVVAEEGLLGHQGHFLISENSEIPGFLKRDLELTTHTHAETMVRMGKTMLINELKQNHALAPDVDEEDFSILERYYEIRKQIDGFQIFEIVYADYVYFTTGKNIDKAAKALFEFSGGDDTFTSEAYKNRLLAYYNGEFWKEYGSRIGRWAYVIANENAAYFEERMAPLGEDAKERVLEQLHLGYWPPSSLRRYFDFLVNEELKPKEALRS